MKTIKVMLLVLCWAMSATIFAQSGEKSSFVGNSVEIVSFQAGVEGATYQDSNDPLSSKLGLTFTLRKHEGNYQPGGIVGPDSPRQVELSVCKPGAVSPIDHNETKARLLNAFINKKQYVNIVFLGQISIDNHWKSLECILDVID